MKTNQRGDIETIGSALVIGFVVLVVAASISIGLYQAVGTHRYETFTVNKSERITSSSGKSSKYLVYTDRGVYENTDSLFNGKFGSSDLYNQIEPHKTYTCDVTGWRNGFFSWYPNLIKCNETR